MNTKHLRIGAVVLAASSMAIMAQPAHAIVAQETLTIQSVTDSILSHTGPDQLPTVYTSGTVGVSNANNIPHNDGNVTILPYPASITLSQGSPNLPVDPLFVVAPNNSAGNCSWLGCPTDTAVIQVTINFKLNGVSGSLVEDVDYAATLPDTDSLTWVGEPAGGYAFTVDGQNFTITLDNESDWNMAEYDALEYTGSSVPEPGSLAILGTALAGLGAVRRRRRKAA